MQVSEEISQLQREMKQTMNEVKNIVNRIEKRVGIEVHLQDIIYCEANSELLFHDENQMINQNEDNSEDVSAKIQRKLQKLETFQVLTKYIEYTIRQLERRQIAESVTKILKV